MFLSNPRNYFLLSVFFALILQACGSSAGNDNRPVSMTTQTRSEFPFSTKEPEVYQGDFVVSVGKNESRWFVARKGEKARFDIFSGNERSVTRLTTENIYVVDHRKKVYAAAPAGSDSTGFADGITENFFRGKAYREFEDLGLDGELKKYKVREDPSGKDKIFIYVDQASGMIVKQEFTGQNGEAGSPFSYIYEIRNLKLDVDDSMFAIPEGYRKVSWDEYRKSR